MLTTGLLVERAKRGFNPHHRKNPSYYPILATLSQTRHVIGHRNRCGNVHDSHRSAEFLRKTLRTAREELGLRGCFELRVDSAFFQREFLNACDRARVEYAVKVPMWPWLNLRAIVKCKSERDWQWVNRRAGLQGLFAELPILEVLLAETLKKKAALTERPRAPKAGAGASAAAKSTRSRDIPAAIKREVWLREQGGCGFVGANGKRCGETRGLEFAHRWPWAKGGENSAANLSLRCKAHNTLEADRDYGEAFMRKKRERGAAPVGRKAESFRVRDVRATYRCGKTRSTRPSGRATSCSRPSQSRAFLKRDPEVGPPRAVAGSPRAREASRPDRRASGVGA